MIKKGKQAHKTLNGRDILVTGGTGSFGKRFIEKVLQEHHPRRVVIYSRDEMKHAQMREETVFQDKRLRFFIGDIRDKERLYSALSGVDIVIHTAAMRMITDTEYNPFEAVKTNIYGAKNLIEGCIEQGVLKIIALSPDKATNPVSLFGGTKFVAEKLFIDGNIYGNNTGVRFACVRFGDIIGSRSNVITEVQKQIKKGEVTLTTKDMSRYFISLDQAVHFVISSLDRMIGGEIFVPKSPSFKVEDFVKKVAPEIKITIQARPGEKDYETLLSRDEAKHTYMYDDYFTIYPEYPEWNLGRKGIAVGELCEEEYSHCSNLKDNCVNISELLKYLS